MVSNKLILSVLLFFTIFFLSCASGHKAMFLETQPLVRDISSVSARLLKATSSSQLSMKVLGEVEYGKYKVPIWVVTFTPVKETKYRVFLNGGVHGNEPAGAELMVETIEMLAKDPKKYENISFDIVPIVNPWGWSHNIRFNQEGRDINRDFVSFKAQESTIIKKFIEGKTYDIMTDHHEDPGGKGFYIYQYGNPDTTLSRRVIEAERGSGYPIEQDVSMIILKTKDGLIDAPMWGLWYMKATRQLSLSNYARLYNSKKVYTLETPTILDLKNRLRMHQMALEILIDSLYQNELRSALVD